MSLFHKHHWRKSAATYVPPWEGGNNNRYVPPEARSSYSYTGITTVLLICDTCGGCETVKMAGKPIDKALADLVGVEDDE